MASEATGVSGLAGRYATALFDLANENNALDPVANDLATLARMIAESADLSRVLRSPILSREQQSKALAALTEQAGFNPITKNFINVVARNRRLFALADMAKGFRTLLANKRGEVTATVTAAQYLSQSQIDAISEKLNRAVGSKVTLDIWVDPSIIGGLIVKIGSRMVDGSLRSKLQRLQLAMRGI